jgi:hypothetical protein
MRRHLTPSIVALKLVFDGIDVPLFEAFGAELGAKQADGVVLKRKAAFVAADGVPRPLFRSPIRMIDHAHRDTLDFRRCLEREHRLAGSRGAEPLVLPGVSQAMDCGLEDLEACLVAFRPDLAALLGFANDLARGVKNGRGPARESETEFVLCGMVPTLSPSQYRGGRNWPETCS